MKKIREWSFFPTLLLILLVCHLLTDPAELFRTGKVDSRNRNMAGILAEKEESIDLLILGDSEAYTSISPLQLWQETGIPAYNCGQQGQNIVETWSVFTSALRKQHPKMVLLETNLLRRYPGDAEAAQLILAEQFYRTVPFLRYHSFWKDLGKKRPDDDWVKGFHIVRDKEFEEEAEGGPGKHFAVPPVNLRYLEKIIKRCREEDIQLVLYSAPAPKEYSRGRIKRIRKLAKRWDLPYLDLNGRTEEIGIDWNTDSYDSGDHLNLSGAERVTHYIGGLLSGSEALPDRREEKRRAAWNREAEYYRQRAERILKKLRNDP